MFKNPVITVDTTGISADIKHSNGMAKIFVSENEDKSQASFVVINNGQLLGSATFSLPEKQAFPSLFTGADFFPLYATMWGEGQITQERALSVHLLQMLFSDLEARYRAAIAKQMEHAKTCPGCRKDLEEMGEFITESAHTTH